MTTLTIGGIAPRIAGTLIGVPRPPAAQASAPSALGTAMAATDWWDATSPSGLLSTTGVALTAYAGSQVGGLASRVTGGGPLQTVTSYGGVSAGGMMVGQAHVNRLLGAVGAALDGSAGTNANGLPFPLFNQTVGLTTATTRVLSAGSAWSFALAWTRPNARNRDAIGVRTDGMVVLAALGATPIVWLDGIFRNTRTGADTGSLFVLGTAIATNVPLRHCHTLLLVNAPGAGVTAYLDGVSASAASGITVPAAMATATPLWLLLDPTDGYTGGAQLWLHEAALGGALSGAQIAATLAWSSRYVTGQRPAALILPLGQSNLGNMPGLGYHNLRTLIAYYTGCVSVDYAPSVVAPGQGVYYDGTGSYLAATPGTDASTWPTGDAGTRLLTNLAGLPPIRQPDVAAIWTYYSEDLSTPNASYRPNYATAKTNFEGAWRNFIGRVRTAAGKTPAQLPVCATREIPFYGPPELQQSESDGWDELAADTSFALTVTCQNTWDANGAGGTSGDTGDTSHISGTDHLNNVLRMAAPMARRLAVAGYGDIALPSAGMPGGLAVTGPTLTRAQFCNAAGVAQAGTSAYVLVTVQHDTGTALLLPGTSGTGIGWTLHDGWGGASSRGTSIFASAARALDATHLVLTFTAAPAGVARLCYCEGAGGTLGIGRLGTGNAVTDNAAAQPAIPGFDVASDLGAGLLTNFPLPSTPGGIALG